MPQMKPMNWIILFNMLNMMILIINIKNYYIYNKKMNNYKLMKFNLNNNNNNNNNWKW